MRKCYEFGSIPGIKASGAGHFDTGVWLRDAALGALGALAIGAPEDVRVTKQCVNFFLKSSPDIPFRVLEQSQGAVYLGIDKPSGDRETNVPVYKGLYNPAVLKEYLAGNPKVADVFLVVMLAGNYLSSNKVADEQKQIFWERHEQNIKNFLNNYYGRFCSQKGLIIHEPPLGSRQDTVLKSGSILLTNVLWYKSIRDLADGVDQLDTQWSNLLKDFAEKVRNQINNTFWRSNRYLDWINGNKEYNYFNTMGHFWAIISGVADKERQKKILEFTANHKKDLIVAKSGLVATTFPRYAPQLIDTGLRIIGFQDYYNSIDGDVFWPETTILYAGALKTAGQDKQAAAVLKKIENILTEYRTLHENYDAGGKPTNRPIMNYEWTKYFRKSNRVAATLQYSAPPHFAMALGIYLWIKKNWDNLSTR